MKKGMKRVIAFVMALVMTFSIKMPEKVEAASSSDTYNGGYGIEDILTYYQYFTRGDAYIPNDTIGPVAVGGTLVNNGGIGKAAKVPSFAGHIASADVASDENFESECAVFYYGTTDIQGPNLKKFTQNSGYINMESAFTTLKAQSEQWANDANAIAPMISEDGGVITCDFSQGIAAQTAADSSFISFLFKLYLPFHVKFMRIYSNKLQPLLLR